MLYAPPVIDLIKNTYAAAAVDAAVGLDEYAACWQRALSGKPVHFENLEIKEFFVGEEELSALNALYEANDGYFSKRK